MAPLTLTILGAGPAAPNQGGACSGYLVREHGSAVLVDCGSGVAGRVAQHVPPRELSGVAISHLHPDHYFDLVPLYYILKFGEPRRPDLAPRLPVYVPPGGREFLARFGQMISDKPAMLEDVFEICEYSSDLDVQLGSLQFTFVPVQHYVLSHAIRIRDSSGATIVFSSDVGPCQALVDAARDADLFMCESALRDASEDEPNPKKRGHMSAAEAGRTAREAGACRLLLTHYRSGPKYDEHHRSAAEQTFGGPVELAREGQTYSIG
jgi:ribonuclease BN (tRNA processing enzyme)